jgi:hypothetical protein
MSAESLVEDIINQAIETGIAKSAEATAFADRADVAAQGWIGGNPNLVSFTPESIEPPVNIPMNATGLDVALYGTNYERIIDDLSNQFATFFATYFPDECDYIAHAQQWICDALTEGGTGINAAVEDQIWQRDRARVLKEVNRASTEALATFAARGFPIPPGAAQHQVYMAQQEAQDKIAQHSRDVAIKQAELEIENVKFAVQQALDYRIKGIAAAADYIKTLALGPEIAMKLATSAASAQANLISAASSYYNARIRIEEIKLDVKKTNASESNTIQRQEIIEFGNRLAHRSSVLSAAATAAGNQAASALNAVHASAQIAVQGDAA